MKNKNYVEAPKPNEIKCCAIRLTAPKKMVDEQRHEFTTEGKEFLDLINELGKKHKYLGMTPNYPYMFVLFRIENAHNATDFFTEMNGRYDVKVVKDTCYVDERYFVGEFAGSCIELPPQEMVDEVKSLMDKYSQTEIKRVDDIEKGLFIYKGDLGFREFEIIISAGGHFMSCGIANGQAHISKNALTNYKTLLMRFENDLAGWCADHPNLAKGEA